MWQKKKEKKLEIIPTNALWFWGNSLIIVFQTFSQIAVLCCLVCYWWRPNAICPNRSSIQNCIKPFSTPIRGWNCVEMEWSASMQEQWYHMSLSKWKRANYINIGENFPYIWKWNVNVAAVGHLLPAVTWKLRIKTPTKLFPQFVHCHDDEAEWWWTEAWQITHRRFVSTNVFEWMNKVNVVHEPHDDVVKKNTHTQKSRERD